MKGASDRWRLAFLICVLGASASALPAQERVDWDGQQVHITREALEQVLSTYEEAATSPAYSHNLRVRARFEAALLRARLEEGDFRVGDQITLLVIGQPDLSRTYAVDPGPVLVIPTMGEISLRGVLRSELEGVVSGHLSQYIRNPVVRATSTIRITVTGAVAQPGFKVVESRMLLTDVLNEAGGPTAQADLRRIRIERGGQRIWDGDVLHDAVIEGRTLDELSLRAGDQVIVPEQEQSALSRWVWRLATPSFVFFILRRLL